MHISSTELNKRPGECLDKAQNGPVTIEKKGQAYAVIMSQEEFEGFQAEKKIHLRGKILKALKDGKLTQQEAELGIAYLEADPKSENYSGKREAAYIMATMPEIMNDIRAINRGEEIETFGRDSLPW